MSASKNICFFSLFKNFDANEEVLKKLFEHPEVNDREIVIISITETKRKGKSYFLNCCLKFLYNHFPSINACLNPNLSKLIDDDLTGYNDNHDSDDVLIWNDLFLYTNQTTGEKLAIVILDTVMSLNNSAFQEDHQKIVEFTTILSSIQIINLYSEIDANQLEFLKHLIASVKTEVFKQNDTNLKSLHHLVVFARDWSNSNIFAYGYEEGEKYLTKLLEYDHKINLISTLELFKSSFEKISCILLPHPGKIFVNKSKDCSELNDEFKDEVAAGIRHALKPEHLAPKRINYSKLRGSTFFECVQKQVSSYRKENVQNAAKTGKDIKLSKVEFGSSHGDPIQVLKPTDDNKLLIEDEALRKLFEHKDLKDRKIVAFSTIGVYRKGKSFFLNYCLRYLYAHYPSINCPKNLFLNSNNWMGEKNEPLTGFLWRSGSIRDTSGIVMWNDAFLHTNTNGEQVAIIVVDTQGLFESGTLPIDDSKIFTLGTLISSILVLNLFNVVQENQLEYLQYSIETAKYAIGVKQQSEEKPFQHLMFLIRDWGNHDDHPCGLEGGSEYLNYFLKSKIDKKEEFKSICEVICDSFEKIDCSLLPHPGNTVAVGRNKNKKYDGCWSDMDEDFSEELKKLIEFLLSPENLIPRKVNGMSLNALEYLGYIQKCFKLFQSDQLPQVKTIRDSTVDKDMNKLINSCFNHYKDIVRSKLKDIKNLNELQHLHEMAMLDGMNLYKTSKKMGDYEHEEKFRKSLESMMSTYMKEITVKEERNFKVIEDEARKLKMLYEQKVKLQNEVETVDMGDCSASGSNSVRSPELKPKENEFASSGFNQQQIQSKQQIQPPRMHHTQHDPISNKDLNALVDLCVNEYKKMMLEIQDLIINEESFQIYHEMNKSGALLKFEDLNKVGNTREAIQSKKILENEIEQIFKDFKIHLENCKLDEIERNRIVEMEEVKRRKEEQIEQDRKFAEKIAKLEQLKSENKSNEQHIQEKLQLELKFEKEKAARIKAEEIYIAEREASREQMNIFKKFCDQFMEKLKMVKTKMNFKL